MRPGSSRHAIRGRRSACGHGAAVRATATGRCRGTRPASDPIGGQQAAAAAAADPCGRRTTNTRGRARDGSRVPPRGAGPNWGSGPVDDARGARRRREGAPVLGNASGGGANPIAAGRRTSALARLRRLRPVPPARPRERPRLGAWQTTTTTPPPSATS
ncbi:hypothetical protein B5P24_15160 [Clavibacter tessellarius]|uniref:Uncharacterized protein n=1 Tax=Clavibacter tessellarius TaxID=31965 RepID=A0A225CEP6_9MICO|nr:hypothetical protein B5P24_15160 [Clavibacter michiganensis subsp. tessellarius]